MYIYSICSWSYYISISLHSTCTILMSFRDYLDGTKARCGTNQGHDRQTVSKCIKKINNYEFAHMVVVIVKMTNTAEMYQKR